VDGREAQPDGNQPGCRKRQHVADHHQAAHQIAPVARGCTCAQRFGLDWYGCGDWFSAHSSPASLMSFYC
jgi:hypothetical protein